MADFDQFEVMDTRSGGGYTVIDTATMQRAISTVGVEGFGVLVTIMCRKRISITELCRLLGESKATIHTIVNSLVKHDFVTITKADDSTVTVPSQ